MFTYFKSMTYFNRIRLERFCMKDSFISFHKQYVFEIRRGPWFQSGKKIGSRLAIEFKIKIVAIIFTKLSRSIGTLSPNVSLSFCQSIIVSFSISYQSTQLQLVRTSNLMLRFRQLLNFFILDLTHI